MRDSPPSEEDSSLLVLVLDTNPFVWNNAGSRGSRNAGGDALSLEDAVKHVLVFLNAYLALTHDNRLAVIASHVGKSAFLYPFPTSAARGSRAYIGGSADTARESQRPASEYQNFKLVDDQVVARLRKLFDDVETPLGHSDKSREAVVGRPAAPSSFSAPLFLTRSDGPCTVAGCRSQDASMISGALSMALCYINSVLKHDVHRQIKARICVLSVSADSAYQYIPVMNSIFSAQKMSVPIDVCKLFDEETVFLQQAAHLTGGIYQHVEKPSGLMQHLLFTFLRDQYTRTLMVNPSEDRVDFRAACFCHKRIVDVAHVCSVCLSIFCAFFAVCSTCRTKFNLEPSSAGGTILPGVSSSAAHTAPASADNSSRSATR